MANSESRGKRGLIKVLHVDDELDQLKFVRLFLEEQGFEIESVTSPDDVPSMLEHEAFDAVVSDYVMPGMDGVELRERVKQIRDIPFIIYTAKGGEEVAAQALRSGVDIYIRKELEPEHYGLLARRLEEAVRKRREEMSRAATLEILQILSVEGDLQDILGRTLRILQRCLGVEAVGIRLRDGDDYPYYVFDGFHDEHILLENQLCAYDLEGQLIRDEVGNPVLDCMCGNVLRERFDPSKPFFTEGGSFWTNSSTELLATTTDEDRLIKTRNTCQAEGYESVALIPIRHEGETLGLLQLNEPRPGAFSEETVGFLERLGEAIGAALSRAGGKQKALESLERYKSIFNNVPHPTFIIDPDELIILLANDAAINQTSGGREEIEGGTCYSIIAGYDAPCDIYGETCPIVLMLEEGRMNVTIALQRLDEDGNITVVEESVSPVGDAEGMIDMVVLIAREVSGQGFAGRGSS
ncbi:MAG: response regulator [Candidatus Bathyarchaeota archaeon]|nr:MAG: response regulator [Candidatus Bathyarchaeota archaeon]